MKEVKPVNSIIGVYDGGIQNHLNDVNESYSMIIPDFFAFEDTEGIDRGTYRIQAKQWIHRTEDFFELNKTPEKEKSILASLSLKGLAYSFYISELESSKQDYMSWEDFKKLLYKYVIPDLGSSRIYYYFELLNIRMDAKMTVSEYTKQFWKFKYRCEVGEESAMLIYLNGLLVEIKDIVVNQSPKNLVTAIEMAYAAEIESKFRQDSSPIMQRSHGKRTTFKNNSRTFNGRGNYRFKGNKRGFSNNNRNRNNGLKKKRGNMFRSGPST